MLQLVPEDQQEGPMLLDVASTLSLSHTDAERLLVLDILGWVAEDASTCIVDDPKTRRSSPWALTLACKAIGAGASHFGVVYECGDAAKSTLSMEGVPGQAIHVAPLHFRGILQHGSLHMVRLADANPLLGVPDGLPQPRMDGTPHSSPAATNQAVRLRILRTLGTKAAIAMRVASSHATRCPVPVVARRFYMARADAKLSYLLPLVFGVQVWRPHCWYPRLLGAVCHNRSLLMASHPQGACITPQDVVCRPGLGLLMDQMQSRCPLPLCQTTG